MRKHILGFVVFIAVLAAQGLVSAQEIKSSQLEEAENSIQLKWGQALPFLLQSKWNEVPADFKSQQKLAAGLGISAPAEGELVTRGALARALVNLYDLGGSLLYSIFKSERYAHRLLVYHEVYENHLSEHDHLSGLQFFEVLSRAETRLGKGDSDE